jgi:hypothetical protein
VQGSADARDTEKIVPDWKFYVISILSCCLTKGMIFSYAFAFRWFGMFPLLFLVGYGYKTTWWLAAGAFIFAFVIRLVLIKIEIASGLVRNAWAISLSGILILPALVIALLRRGVLCVIGLYGVRAGHRPACLMPRLADNQRTRGADGNGARRMTDGEGDLPDTAAQAAWRVEFEQAGESEVRQNLSNAAIYNSEPKRAFARQWLRQQERAHEIREHEIYSYTQWTFWAAVAAVIVGIIGIMVASLH